MELEGRLEELLSTAADRVRTEVDARRPDPVITRDNRRRVTLGVAGGALAVSGAFVAAGLGFDVGLMTGMGAVGVATAGPLAGMTFWRRRQTADEVAQARRLAEARKRARKLPKGLRADVLRMHQARGLVGELAGDGHVAEATLREVDRLIEDLDRALDATGRLRRLGGGESDHVPQQVADLADLLVALADEAVESASEVLRADTAPATLAEARERLVALRQARRTVADVDAAAQVDWARRLNEVADGTTDGTTGTQPPEQRPSTG